MIKKDIYLKNKYYLCGAFVRKAIIIYYFKYLKFREMKKLVLFAAVAFAASFAACSTTPAAEEATEAPVSTEATIDANYAFEGDTLLLPNAEETAIDTVVIAD